MKKLMAILMAVTLIFSMSGCGEKKPADVSSTGGASQEQGSGDAGDDDKAKTIDTSEKITISVFGSTHPFLSDWEDITLFDTMSEKFNVKFEFENAPADAYQEKLGLKMASKQLPDLLFPAQLTPSREVQYASEGLLLPLNDLIDTYGDNTKALFAQHPDVQTAFTTPDGNIYSLGDVLKQSIAQVQYLWVNGYWLEELEITEFPETLDELTVMLKRFRDEDPNGNGKADEIPVMSEMKIGAKHYFLGAFGLANDSFEEVDGNVRFNAATENYKSYLEYVKMLFDEKLIDPNMFTQNFEQSLGKSKSGIHGIAAVAVPSISYDADLTLHKMLPPVTSEYATEKLVLTSAGINRGAAAITTTNENPERTFQILDWLYSDEGSILSHYGPEGGYWKWADDSQEKRELMPLEEGQAAGQLRGKYTVAVGLSIPKNSKVETEKTFANEFSAYRIEEADKLAEYGKTPMPLLYLTAEEQAKVTAIESDITSYIEQMTAKFITSAESLDDFDAYVAQLEKMGLQEYTDIYQTAYDRVMK